MSDVQKVIIIGRLGRDPELRSTNSGKQVCNFSVAVNEKWEGGESTEWFAVVVWDRMGEACAQYLRKGSKVYVEGRLRTRTFTGRDGTEKKTTDLQASAVKFLDKAGDRTAANGGAGGRGRREERQQQSSGRDRQPQQEQEEEDLPF